MDLIRLAARITLEVAAYNQGLDAADRKAKQTAQSIGKSTDDMAAKTESANQRVAQSYGGASKAITEHRNAREELVGSVNEVLKSIQEEKRLFEQGKISYEEFTGDIDLLNGEYREATKRLREWDDMVKQTNGDVGKSEGSYRGMTRGIGLAITAIVALTRAAINGVKKVYGEAGAVSQSSSYFDVGGNEYERLQEIAMSNGLDKGMADTLLNSVFEISQGLMSGDSESYLSLSRLGISAEQFNGMNSDADRAMAILMALQGITDKKTRRQTSIDVLGADTGRAIQAILEGEDVAYLYDLSGTYAHSDEWYQAMSDRKNGIDRAFRIVGNGIVDRDARRSINNYIYGIDSPDFSYDPYTNGLDASTIHESTAAIVNGVSDVVRENNSRPINVYIGGEKVDSWVIDTANKQTVKSGRRSLDSITGYGGSQ